VRQARLADPGVADDRHGTSAARDQAVENRRQRGELVFAADKRAPICRGFGPARAFADQLPRDDRLRLAFQRELADRLEREPMARQLVGELTHVRLAARGRRFEALREDHRVAENGVVGAGLAAEDSPDAVAGVHADVERQLGLPRERADHPRELLVHLECAE
jgi:hypothetical protein